MWPNLHFIRSPGVVMGRWKGTETGWKYLVNWMKLRSYGNKRKSRSRFKRYLRSWIH